MGRNDPGIGSDDPRFQHRYIINDNNNKKKRSKMEREHHFVRGTVQSPEPEYGPADLKQLLNLIEPPVCVRGVCCVPE